MPRVLAAFCAFSFVSLTRGPRTYSRQIALCSLERPWKARAQRGLAGSAPDKVDREGKGEGRGGEGEAVAIPHRSTPPSLPPPQSPSLPL